MIALIATPNRYGHFQGNAYAWLFDQVLLPLGYNQNDCLLHQIHEPIDPRAEVVILFGIKALQAFTSFNSLHNHRGEFLVVKSLTGSPLKAIATFDPQDAYDFKMSGDDDEYIPNEGTKEYLPTKPKNFRFWIKRDVIKLLIGRHHPYEKLKAIFYPPLQQVIDRLYSLENSTLYLDIENRIHDRSLNCIGLAYDESPVVVIPIYRYNNTLAYDNLPHFFHALAIALSRNRVVVHNCLHDLILLSTSYRIPFGRDIFDTMVAHNRIWPNVEKSLGHCISLYTAQPFHKDSSLSPKNPEQEQQFWTYNANDVHAMRCVYKEQLKVINANSGLKDSVDLAMRSLYLYLTMAITGIGVNAAKRLTVRRETQDKLKQILRLARIFSGIPTFNPGSSDQCVKYFHDSLRYAVVTKSRKTGRPSLDSKAIYQLRTKYDNPLLDIVIAYRIAAKKFSMLEFNPWNIPCLS